MPIGLLATAISKMDGIGNLAGWQWIFALEGIATVIFAIVAAIILPASIASASFLTKEEKEFALHRVRIDAGTTVTTTTHSDCVPPSSAEKTEDSKIERTEASQLVIINWEDEVFEWREVRRGLLDAQTWLTGIAYFAFVVSLYSYSLFLPTIVTGLGYSGSQAQLHTG
ncbi:hypothetical protein VKT23_011178 [Stygiomarasmius scandens]|uniref:Major facilitator superfamily (MFS) profile domain-containing protein n=1 Tax=Marasmiellus scandens TaxID=2682957 RepID=A0ABR1JCS6_9AGAR